MISTEEKKRLIELKDSAMELLESLKEVAAIGITSPFEQRIIRDIEILISRLSLTLDGDKQ